MMTSREVIMTSLANERPDRIGYMEMQVDKDAARLIMGRDDFGLLDLADKLHFDAIGAKNVPPVLADKKVINGRPFTTEGHLTTLEAVENMTLPDPDDPTLYEEGQTLIRQNRGEGAVFTKIRLGPAPTMNSMGIENFCCALHDQPELVCRALDAFTNWQTRVLEHLNKMDFDFYWAADDLAFKTGPLMSPAKFREICLPYMRRVVEVIEKPWVFHSDGNLLPIIEDLLSLGMNALHPIEPAALDIVQMKQEYGDRICLVGNIDLDTVLSRGTLEDVDHAVQRRIQQLGQEGGYIVSSSNTIPSYAKRENVVRLGEAVRRYGKLISRGQ